MTDLRKSLDKLADSVAKEAARDGTDLQEKIDALKALTPYYVATQKHGSSEDDSGELTFGDLQSQIDGQEPLHGSPIRPRRRNGRPVAPS